MMVRGWVSSGKNLGLLFRLVFEDIRQRVALSFPALVSIAQNSA